MGKILVVGVKDSSYHNVKFEYKNEYNLEDYKSLISLFRLLEEGFNAPINKVIQHYQSVRQKDFPI